MKQFDVVVNRLSQVHRPLLPPAKVAGACHLGGEINKHCSIVYIFITCLLQS